MGFHQPQGCGHRPVKVEEFRVGVMYEDTIVDS